MDRHSVRVPILALRVLIQISASGTILLWILETGSAQLILVLDTGNMVERDMHDTAILAL